MAVALKKRDEKLSPALQLKYTQRVQYQLVNSLLDKMSVGSKIALSNISITSDDDAIRKSINVRIQYPSAAPLEYINQINDIIFVFRVSQNLGICPSETHGAENNFLYTETPYHQHNLDLEMIKNIFTKANQQFNECPFPEKLILASMITAIKNNWHDHCPPGVQWAEIEKAAAQHEVFQIGAEVLRRYPVLDYHPD